MPTDTANATTPALSPVSCPRCNGSGTYNAPSRFGVRCFGCNGTGRDFTTRVVPFVSPAFHVTPNQATTVPAMNSAERNWHTFATRYPAEAAWLQSPVSGDFGASLVRGCRRYGGLTPRQLAAVQRSIATSPVGADIPFSDGSRPSDAVPAAAPIVGATPEGRPVTAQDVRNGAQVTFSSMIAVARSDFRGAVNSPAPIVVTAASIVADPVRRAMEAAAASGLRKVRLVLGAVTFKLSGNGWRNGAGMILCYESGSYAGWIDRQNNFHVASYRIVRPAMLEAFRLAASDPQAAARTYGQDTGRCACCRRLLTDPVSVMSNIGPVCAERFGWGRMIRTAVA